MISRCRSVTPGNMPGCADMELTWPGRYYHAARYTIGAIAETLRP
jgi:hypothetical protein